MTRFLIARHGNTFDPGDEILRVGARTNLPLSTSGKEQAIQLGNFLQANDLVPNLIMVSNLIRTQETAKLAFANHKYSDIPITEDSRLNEIDYGPDEGQPEKLVKQRLGNSLNLWEEKCIVPDGWQVNPTQLIDNWREIANEILTKHHDKLVLIVTSNGIARFAPYLTGDYPKFLSQYQAKLRTGSASLLVYNGSWQIEFWNKP